MHKSILFVLFIFLGVSVSPAQTAGGGTPPRVKTADGIIQGIQKSSGVHVFKGIPFAAAPVGNLRWKAPRPVKPWSGVRNCTEFGPSPMQGKPVPFSMWSQEFLIPEKPISEDCLYLNVWSGARGSGEKRPVLVWIYGGGFSSGGSGVPIYDGEAMARKGIVFVSINYRVGIFGFFALPALSRESGHQASGNYGLLDQIAALKWVQKNISAFGGDPSRITIAGQSAGSMSVNCLVASPLAKGLFQRAIGESGASFSLSMQSLQNAESQGVSIMEKLKVKTLDELRKLPASVLMAQSSGFRGPIVDGFVLPESVSDLFEEDKVNKVDLLTGWNQEEGLLFGPIRDAEHYREYIEKQYGRQADSLLHYYPAGNDSIATRSQYDLSRDQIFGTGNYAWANRTAAEGSRVFVYRFTRKLPATGVYRKYGAFHTGEVPYAYDNLKFVNRPWEKVDHQLAGIMSDFWANFIKNGDPNREGLPNWPAYELATRRIMILGVNCRTVPLPDRAALDFLTGLSADQ